MVARVGTSTVTLAGGTLQVLAKQGNDTISVGTVALGSGMSTLSTLLINSSPTGTGSMVLTLGGLVQSSAYGTVNVTYNGQLGRPSRVWRGQPAQTTERIRGCSSPTRP